MLIIFAIEFQYRSYSICNKIKRVSTDNDLKSLNSTVELLRLSTNPQNHYIKCFTLHYTLLQRDKRKVTTDSSVPEILTSGPAKGLHGLDSHSGISVAAVINVHECRSCVITAHARSPGSSVSFVRFSFIFHYQTHIPFRSFSPDVSRGAETRRSQ